MRKIKSTLLVVIPLILIHSCSDDDNNGLDSEPVYDLLSIQALETVQTPYQYVFNPTKSGVVALKSDDLNEVKEKINEIFPDGKIDDIDEDEERGIEVWEIEVYMYSDDDDELEFFISKELLEVIKIEGDGLVDYDINPGGDFIRLSEAILAANLAVSGTIEDWELEYDNRRWVYEFEYESNQDDDVEVIVNAFNGNVIGVFDDDYIDDDDDLDEADDDDNGDDSDDGDDGDENNDDDNG